MSAASSPTGWNLDFSYFDLPSSFYTPTLPEPVREPALVYLNRPLAEELGLRPDAWEEKTAAAWFAAQTPPPGARPFAQAYAGHQFAHFTMLGDGRAMVMGEQICPQGSRRDLQWKGSGRTPYSRRGDGRAALGPMLREVLISEALHHLGLPTTRSLAVATTGEAVYRDRPLPGAVLTRVAASHLRVGTFEFAAARQNPDELEALARYTLRRHYPEEDATEFPGRALLTRVAERQLDLVARWMSIGFIHGVLNTDNVALSGESIDFGPCAFLDTYRAATVFSSIDRHGRYRYEQQPAITLWNLSRLAETLLPLIAPTQPEAIAWAEEFLHGCQRRFPDIWLEKFRPKLGLFNAEDGDLALLEDLLTGMEKSEADFTQTFRQLAPGGQDAPAGPEWQARWVARLARQPQSAEEVAALRRASNPVLHPRNHRVEEALAAAVEHGDYRPFQRLLEALAHPFEEHPQWADLASPPEGGGQEYQTFCGT